MFVYFVTQSEDEENDVIRIKIGLTKNKIEKRISQLQTGSSHLLKLMGWVECKDAIQLENQLHTKYANSLIRGEWFWLTLVEVLEELKNHGTNGYLALQNNLNEIISYDSDCVPEYVSSWEWSDIDFQDFCPHCGCSCGLSYNENYGDDRCLNCGVIN